MEQAPVAAVLPSSVETSSIPSKEELEREKILIEVRQMQKSWFRQPQHWWSGVGILLTSCTVLIAVISTNFRSERAIFEGEKAEFAVIKAKEGITRANAERDAAIVDRTIAEGQAQTARSKETEIIARMESASIVLRQIEDVRVKLDPRAIHGDLELHDRLADLLFPTTIIVRGRGPDMMVPVQFPPTTQDASAAPTTTFSIPIEKWSVIKPSRFVEFHSDPEGVDVHDYVIRFLPNGIASQPSSIAMGNLWRMPVIGKTPCTVPVGVGRHCFSFFRGDGVPNPLGRDYADKDHRLKFFTVPD